MAATSALAGLIEPHLPNAGQPINEISVAQAIGMSILLFGWCRAHARTNAIPTPPAAPILVALFAIVGVPYYAFRGFGGKKGMALVAYALATAVGLYIVYVSCFILSAQLGA